MKSRALGRLVVLVAVQVSVLGLYRPPVFKLRRSISAPDDHLTAGPNCRVELSRIGRLVVLVAVQVSVLGLYRPPVFKWADAIRVRPRRSSDCRSKLPCGLLAHRAHWWC